MGDFRDFARFLFPGQLIPPRQNPSELPDEVKEILKQVAERIGAPQPWLEESAGLIVDGLAGLQCLRSLHGASGNVTDVPIFIRSARDTLQVREELYALAELAEHRAYDKAQLGSSPVYWVSYTPHWVEGTVVKQWHNKQGAQERVIKMEGWLRRQGASDTLLRAFKTRRLRSWEWKISVHPFDVLTMSFNRPRTDHMQPGRDPVRGYGILTDMAAGSAMMFFYRPGSDVPAGRLLLRPALDDDGKPCIYGGRIVYGSGLFGEAKPMPIDVLSELLDDAGVDLPVYDGDICLLGEQGRALTRDVYCDSTQRSCIQTKKKHNDVYCRMGNTPWPVASLDIGALQSLLRDWSGTLLPLANNSSVSSAIAAVVKREGIDEIEDVRRLRDYATDNGLLVRRAVKNWVHGISHVGCDARAHLSVTTIIEIEGGVRGHIMARLLHRLRNEPVMLAAFNAARRDLPQEVSSFVSDCVSSVYECIEKKGLPSNRPAMWFPCPPPQDICNTLQLSENPENVHGVYMFLPSEYDVKPPNALEPYVVRTVIAVCYDDEAKRDFDVGAAKCANSVHPFVDKATSVSLVPSAAYNIGSLVASVV